MIRHLFRLMWNKKKTHTLLMVEIWASFLVLFGLCTMIVHNVRNYSQPLGYDYQDVWAIYLDNNQDTTNVGEKAQSIVQRLKAYPEVASVTRTSPNSPFSQYTSDGSLGYDKASTFADFFRADENLPRTLDVTIVEGHWLRQADSVGKYKPAVINQKAKEDLFGNENPLGKILSNNTKVVGVIGNFKVKGEFSSNQAAVFEFINPNNGWDKTMLVKVKPGTDAAFEAKLVKDITAMVNGWSVEVNYLTDSRKNQNKLTLVPVTIFLIISAFLLINVALGLFGVLNLSITKRRGEIGLRRALGATGNGISKQFVGEIWVLATFGLLIGLIFAVQFPLLNVFDLESGVYVTAILVSIVVIYLIVTLCALFPSRQAAEIQPAVALHEE